MNLYRKLRHYAGIFIRVRWIPSLYLNFRLLPFKQAIKMPFIVKSKVKFRNLTGKVNFQCPVKFGIVQIGKDVDEMPISFVPAQLRIEGRLIIKGKVIINKGANLVVWPRATMTLGRYVMICSGVTVKAVENVTIGDYAMISSGCFIMDSNIHCIRDLATGNVNRPNNPIVIGDNVWMAMSAAALGGARIPSDSVLSRYSFVNKDITQWGGYLQALRRDSYDPARRA